MSSTDKKRSRFADLFADIQPSAENKTSFKYENGCCEKDFDTNDNSNDSKESRKKRRKSRWGGSETDKVVIPGMPTILPKNLTAEQEKIYLLQIQIEEMSRKLRTGDLGIPEDLEARSPSPEPIYNSDGKRLNTREFRVRKKIEDDRHQLVQQMISINPTYKAPIDYKPPQVKLNDKVLIPQEEYPDINFVGLLIGPRGNTLKSMEKETGAKIIIRGKGSIKEGKIGRKDGQPLPGEDEPLHAFLTAATEGAIAAATKQINKIIRQAIELPENQNNLRRTQLRELALLNGTLRENDILSKRLCSNCGSVEHRNWQCPEKTNMVNSMICSNCNGRGHLDKDCKIEKNNEEENQINQSKIDEEYLSLMAELGECSPIRTSSIATASAATATSSNMNTAINEHCLPTLMYENNEEKLILSNASQPLLPTPNIDNSKVVTWIQKQGIWKQVIQDDVEGLETNKNIVLDNASINENICNEASTNAPTAVADGYTVNNYYTNYLQQQAVVAANGTAPPIASAIMTGNYGYGYGYTGPVVDIDGSKTGNLSTISPTNRLSSGTGYYAVPPPPSLTSNIMSYGAYGYGSSAINSSVTVPTTSAPLPQIPTTKHN